jgi:hypothetical protein
MAGSDKRTSLLRYRTDYSRKKFYRTGPKKLFRPKKSQILVGNKILQKKKCKDKNKTKKIKIIFGFLNNFLL